MGEFAKQTTGIIEYLKNQLTSFGMWTNTPGYLTSVSSSSKGFVWGYIQTDGRIFTCKEPCSSGGWTQVGASFKPQDITTDATTVYILHSSNKIASKPVDNTGSWSEITLPFNATKLTDTNGYLWISNGVKVAYCGKPCTTGNWNVKTDNHDILGGGGSAVYGAAPGERAVYKIDETAQSGWKAVPGLNGINTSTLAADADSSVLYAADTAKVYRCEGECDNKDKLEVVNTLGFVPIQNKGSLDINPSSKNVWMAANSNSTGGNLFARLDAPGSGPIIDYVTENQTERDRIFNSLGDAVDKQTSKIAAEMAKRDAAETVVQAIDISDDKMKVAQEIDLVKRQIEQANGTSAGYEMKKKPLLILLVSLAAVALMYLTVGWFLPYSLSMGLAVIGLGVGFGLAIYFSTNK